MFYYRSYVSYVVDLELLAFGRTMTSNMTSKAGHGFCFKIIREIPLKLLMNFKKFLLVELVTSF